LLQQSDERLSQAQAAALPESLAAPVLEGGDLRNQPQEDGEQLCLAEPRVPAEQRRAGDVDDAVHEQDQPQRPRGGLAKQLKPDERHVERQRGVIAEPWRIPESGPEGAWAESLD